MSRCTFYKVKSSLLFWIFILAIMASGRERAHALLATSVSDSSRIHQMPEDITVPQNSPSVENNRPPRTQPMFRRRLQLASIINPQPLNLSATIKTPSLNHSVDCFENISHRLGAAGAEDCGVVVNHVILGYPNPMAPKTFGWNDGRSMSKRRVLCFAIKPPDHGAQESHIARFCHQMAPNSIHQ